MRRPFGWWRRSIRWKLVAILAMVCVVPMLITSQIAASVVSATYQENVESWLTQIGRFFLAGVARGGTEAGRALETPEIRRRVDHIASRVRTARSLGGWREDSEPFGFDLLTLREPDGRLLYSNESVEELKRLPFEGSQAVYLFRGDGRTLLVTGRDQRIDTSTGPVDVFLGTFLDASFIEDIDTIGSLDLTLFYRIDGSLTPVYSSSGAPAGNRLSTEVQSRLEQLAPGDYLDTPGRSDGSAIGVYLPIENGDQLNGVIACSLDLDLGSLPILGSHRLLLLVFATGMVLAMLAGIVLSAFVTRRVAQLSAGVGAVAAGDFTQRIAVSGEDELDHLAIAFNAMSEQLQDYRRLQGRLRRKERFATLGEIAAGFAHEVRNPLGIIKTTAELVQRGSSVEADRRRLGYVADEVRRIDRLIRDFLVFARPVQRTSLVTSDELMRHTMASCQTAADGQGIALIVENRAESALLRVDLDQIVQAFLNLVINALQAMDSRDAGRIRIDVTRLAEPGSVSFLFADEGPGIPPELLERIFDPFVTTKEQGTGLGLATVFAIVESHGGWIEARNGERGGAVFEITLPLAEAALTST
ncbi:ATP-binding protein [Aureimonas sp. AU4]|uniref:sensor histidine kinase n=1 Tax=Aureimonas sp. AU4 TaxID=1638163 RepID=UPI0007832475|nr:ATP-binding protein [Aureimonas sp. AU4]